MNDTYPGSLLIVDDDLHDVTFIKRGLAKAGASDRVQVVRDGGEAVAYLQGAGIYQDRAVYPFPALMILDLKLPKKSGLEVLEWLRSDPLCKDLPVVILTSSKEPGDIARSRELRVMAYHVKPVDYKEFTAVIQSIGQLWRTLTKEGGVSGVRT
jgi:CheY-like chemotaxis protein